MVTVVILWTHVIINCNRIKINSVLEFFRECRFSNPTKENITKWRRKCYVTWWIKNQNNWTNWNVRVRVWFCQILCEKTRAIFVLNEVKDEKKVTFLITFIGHATYFDVEEINSAAQSDSQIVCSISRHFLTHFTPVVNEILKRYKFHQKTNQSICEYIVKLEKELKSVILRKP